MSPVTVIGAIVLTVALCGTFGYKQYTLGVQKAEYANQIKDLQKQKKKLELEKEDLKSFAEYVKTDEYAEEVAREKLGLVHKGEILFVPEEK
ncbi:MAG: septum formation initiator family protein [Lachnospiraceae bacterium]|nr:septum formation initiator family protein [Lachnospiraceae bacterium]